jgi:hypothetical protein
MAEPIGEAESRYNCPGSMAVQLGQSLKTTIIIYLFLLQKFPNIEILSCHVVDELLINSNESCLIYFRYTQSFVQHDMSEARPFASETCP